MGSCIAVAEDDRIQLIIDKGDEGYEDFSKVLALIEEGECMSWYGDVTDENGKERCGLIISANPRKGSES
jgi:hypothetical protein